MLNTLRVVMNVGLALALTVGGIWLVLQDRWSVTMEGEEMVFAGTSLHLLSASALLGAMFSAAIAQAWIRGTVERPPGDSAFPHPAYQGRLLLRYWYLVGPALACFLAAIWLA